jgi:hypothetical protein
MNTDKNTIQTMPTSKKKSKTHLLVLLLSFGVIGYAVGLKYAPEYMPFNAHSDKDDFYAPHAGHCVPELEF